MAATEFYEESAEKETRPGPRRRQRRVADAEYKFVRRVKIICLLT